MSTHPLTSDAVRFVRTSERFFDSTASRVPRVTPRGAPVAAVGDSFEVHMDREALNDVPLELYDVTVSITAFEPNRHIEWTIFAWFLDPPKIGHVYGYNLEPYDGGSSVTSYYDWSRIDPVWKERAIFPILSETNLRGTLGILARTVAPGMPRPIPTAQ